MERLSFLLVPMFAGSFLLACSSTPRHAPSSPTGLVSSKSPIVVFFNGEPVTWDQVSGQLLLLNPVQSIGLYLRWRVLEDKIKTHQIDASPEELRRRAEQIFLEERSLVGVEKFDSRLRKQGLTRADYTQMLMENPTLKVTLQREKVVRYSALSAGWIEADQWLFSSKIEALSFLKKKERERKPVKGVISREAGLPLPPEGMEALFSTEKGEWTPLIQTGEGKYLVAFVRENRPPRPVSFSEAEPEIFNWILGNPPTKAELMNWIEGQLKWSDIEYANRGPSGN